jgi:hypothetical protein
MDVYGKISKPFWDDKPVAIVGGGPSMVGFDYERLRGAHVLAVKRVALSIPWADAAFGWGDLPDKINGSPSRIYWAVPEDQAQPPTAKNITYLHRLDGHGVSEDPGSVFGGKTSGFGAMQVCIHKRAKRVILFGFDYDGGNGGPHIGEGTAQYQRRKAQDAISWASWAEHFRVYVEPLRQLGIEVVNACPTSAIRCFQKVTQHDGIRLLKP